MEHTLRGNSTEAAWEVGDIAEGVWLVTKQRGGSCTIPTEVEQSQTLCEERYPSRMERRGLVLVCRRSKDA